jgi:universal stress protein E
MNRIDHILVVVDPTEVGGQSAVDKAAHLARCLDASVELLICDTESALDEGIVTRRARRTPASNTQLLDLLDALAAPLRTQGTQVALRLIYGQSLHDALLDYIRGSNADLVIKDTHHHSVAKRTFLRNTDWHLTRGCAVPLLLTKRNTWDERPVIMAAVDPNQANESAAALDRDILHSAATLAGRLKGDLHVIHTFIPAAFAAVVAAGGQSTAREYSEALRVENSFRIAQIEHLICGYGVSQGHLHVEMGTPEDCLTEMVRKYHSDVVVMGASSHARWHRKVVGSTAATMLESLPCDILVVRPSDEAQTTPF